MRIVSCRNQGLAWCSLVLLNHTDVLVHTKYWQSSSEFIHVCISIGFEKLHVNTLVKSDTELLNVNEG